MSWAPPLAFDEEEIDDPAIRPATGWKRAERATVRRADLLEDIEWLRQTGYRQATPAQLAMRLGLSRTAVEQALCREKRDRARAAGQEMAGAETG
jgi:hypothetical protein